MGFKELNLPEIFIPEQEGEYVIGRYKRRGIFTPTTFGEMEYMELEADGKDIWVGLSSSLLRMVDMIPEGSIIKIVYVGKQVNPRTKMTFKAFKVYREE